MSKPLANCKTYVEGNGWIYNFELNREETKPKTASELIDDIFCQHKRMKAMVEEIKSNETVIIKVGPKTADEMEDDRFHAKYN